MKKYLIFLGMVLLIGATANAQTNNIVAINQLVVVDNNPGPVISKDIYGHFSENDVLFALREIKVPNLRWPGGCFADTYHWMDGIGPQEKRASIVNTHWGGVTEDNSFGTHEFMKLTELLDCDAYINGNVGSGTVQEMAQWVEYLTSDSESRMTKLTK